VERYCYVLTTLPCNSFQLISHLIEDVPLEELYNQLKKVLLSMTSLNTSG
jgi:hypothetical protein